MPETLAEELQVLASSGAFDAAISRQYLERIPLKRLTRDERSDDDVCVYFLPFNPTTKEILIFNHKKAKLWLSPGGHNDKDENLQQALNREIKKELGIANYFSIAPTPFLLTVTPIDNPPQPCKMHYDVWFVLKTDGRRFQLDPREFHEARWVPIPEAIGMTGDPNNKKAYALVERAAEKL